MKIMKMKIHSNEIILSESTWKVWFFKMTEEDQSFLKKIQQTFHEFFGTEGVLMYMFRYEVDDIFMTFFHNIPEYVESITDFLKYTKLVTRNNPNLKYNNKYSRVWWRSANDDKWTLIEGVLNYNENITRFLSKQVFGTNDFVYCYRTYISPRDLGIYIPDKTQVKCNDQYKIEKEFKIVVSSDISEKYEINNPKNLSDQYKDIKVKIPRFECNKKILESKSSFFVKFNSSSDIYNYFDSYKRNGLNNVYINDNKKDILLFDKNGDGLSPNHIYKLQDDNKLVKIENPPCKVVNDSNNLSSDSCYNTLLCQSSEYGMVSPNGDIREGNNNNATGLIYNYVPKVGYREEYKDVTGEGSNNDEDFEIGESENGPRGGKR